MFRTRHSIEAQLMTKAARRRGSAHRDPSAIEIALGLAAFIAVAALGLFLATAFGG
jgi:hypothetical protein